MTNTTNEKLEILKQYVQNIDLALRLMCIPYDLITANALTNMGIDLMQEKGGKKNTIKALEQAISHLKTGQPIARVETAK